MHRVVRNTAPESLVRKQAEWKALLRVDRNAADNWDTLDTNTKEDIRIALRDMYKGCCCYCEGKVELVSYLHIEHFKPKYKYKKLCYDYNNLHYCCERCNLIKGKKYSTKMFSPTETDPEEFIKYIGEIAVGNDMDGRGTYMINVLKLNERKDLKDERAKLLRELEERQSDINESIEEITRNNYSKSDIEIILPHIKRLRSNMENHMQHGESYCTMFKHNFYEYVEILKKIEKAIEDKYVRVNS